MAYFQKKYQLYVLVGVVIVVGLLFFFLRQPDTPEAPDSALTFSTSSSISKNVTTCSSKSINHEAFVDVKGAVKHAGMYRVKEGMRVMDAIELAGGFGEEADQGKVNFAKLVMDQEIIYVPKVGEEIPADLAQIQAGTAQVATGTTPDVPSTSGGGAAETATEKINLNTADTTKLQELSGIGEKKAQDIIAYRETNGSFQSVDDLLKVSGIGEKTLEKLKAACTV